MAKIHLTSLGCPKNRVDAEHMLGIAQQNGFEIVNDPLLADTLLVNTCAFINDAKEESIDAILQMAELKKSGNKKLIVSGCLAQRYAKDLEKEIPQIDSFLGTSDYKDIGSILKPVSSSLKILNKKADKKLVSQDLKFLEKYDLPRVTTTKSFTSYLRISEGCDNKCAFCIIPKLRGLQRSRTIEDLTKNLSVLAQNGVKEANLIGQDLTAYGFDLQGRPSLADLLSSLASIKDIRWIRQMYMYPRSFSEKYFDVMNSNDNILPYIDMPLQHGSEHVLKLMRRGGSRKRLNQILESLRKNIPNLVLRSTFIVGFPGERKEDFKELLTFLKENEFDRVGIFKYSNEENTESFSFKDQISEEQKQERLDEAMTLQQKISKKKLKSLVGQEIEAVVEGQSDEHEFLVEGRLWSQAPEIDGKLYISSLTPLTQGQFVKVKIVSSHDYDLSGEVVE